MSIRTPRRHPREGVFVAYPSRSPHVTAAPRHGRPTSRSPHASESSATIPSMCLSGRALFAPPTCTVRSAPIGAGCVGTAADGPPPSLIRLQTASIYSAPPPEKSLQSGLSGSISVIIYSNRKPELWSLGVRYRCAWYLCVPLLMCVADVCGTEMHGTDVTLEPRCREPMNLQMRAAAQPRWPSVPSLERFAGDEAVFPARPVTEAVREACVPARSATRVPRSSTKSTKLTLGIPVRIPTRVLPETRDPARWARFEALVLEGGVSRDRLLDAFPEPEDIEDILRTPEADLPACAATIVRALAEAPIGPVRTPGATVRCADCRHFARSTRHPRLGRCGAGESATAAGGWWDTQRRHCLSFVSVSS